MSYLDVLKKILGLGEKKHPNTFVIIHSETIQFFTMPPLSFLLVEEKSWKVYFHGAPIIWSSIHADGFWPKSFTSLLALLRILAIKRSGYLIWFYPDEYGNENFIYFATVNAVTGECEGIVER